MCHHCKCLTPFPLLPGLDPFLTKRSVEVQNCFPRSGLAGALLTHAAACPSGHEHCVSLRSPSAPPKLRWSSHRAAVAEAALHHQCCAGWNCCTSPRGAGLSLGLLSGHFIRAWLLGEAKKVGSSFPGKDILHPRTACLSHPLAQQESRARIFWLKQQDCDGNIK